MEKHEVEVVKGPTGETITISVASTTEHEATLTGIFHLYSKTSSLQFTTKALSKTTLYIHFTGCFTVSSK